MADPGDHKAPGGHSGGNPGGKQEKSWEYVSPVDWMQRLDEFAAKAEVTQGVQTGRIIAAGGLPADQVATVVGDAFSFLNGLVDESPARGHWACAKGCSWCCHQYVSVTAPEAIAIADTLREAFEEDWLAQLKVMLAQRLERIAALHGAKAYFDSRIPCAFLTPAGSCGIYQWRPLMCRGYLSVDLGACQEIYQGKPAAKPPFDRFANRAGNAVLAGVRAGSHAQHRDGGAYELHGALLRALNTPDAAQRWARGEAVFTGCATLHPE